MRARRRGGRRAADPGLPLPPDRSAARRRRDRPRHQCQEGPVPRALGHEECRGEDRLDRQSRTSCCASAARASATTRWSSTCARCRSWRETGYPSCSTRPIRCSSRAGRATTSGGERRVRAGAGARRRRGRRRRRVHGDAPGPRPRAVRRPEHGAAEGHAGAARSYRVRRSKRSPVGPPGSGTGSTLTASALAMRLGRCAGRTHPFASKESSMSAIIDIHAPRDPRQPRQSDRRGRGDAGERRDRPRRRAVGRLDRRA